MIPYGLPEKHIHSLIESTDTPNQTAQAVCNPDGSSIGSSGGGTTQGDFYFSSELETQNVVRDTPGNLLGFNGRFDKDADPGQYFLQFYDSATIPADGPVTILHCVTIEHIAGFSDEIKFEYPRGKAAAAGICFALSSTEFTKTEDLVETFLSLEIEHSV